jgi:hypothetical protein
MHWEVPKMSKVKQTVSELASNAKLIIEDHGDDVWKIYVAIDCGPDDFTAQSKSGASNRLPIDGKYRKSFATLPDGRTLDYGDPVGGLGLFIPTDETLSKRNEVKGGTKKEIASQRDEAVAENAELKQQLAAINAKLEKLGA